MILQKLLLYGVIYPGTAVVLICVLALAAGWKVRPGWLKVATALGVILSIVRLVYLVRTPTLGFDHVIFRKAGLDIWRGLDPYEPSLFANHPYLQPPSALPFFALLSVGPEWASILTVTVAYSAMALVLVFLARAALVGEGDSAVARLSWYELGALAAVVAMSDASMADLELGQLALISAVFILAAMAARAWQRPILAGVALGLATLKVGTMVPFLLLFHRKTDRLAWVALGVTVAGLCLASGHPERLPGQCRSMLHYIGKLSEPGRVNDISYQGPQTEAIVSIDHALYRLGLRDRSLLPIVQFVVLGAIGVAVAAVAWRRSTPPGLATSLVALYAIVFLYHRVYDAVLFAYPLTYALGQAKVSRGKTRATWTATIVCMFGVLFLRRRTLAALTAAVPSLGVIGRLVEVLILPLGTTLTLAAMLLMWLASRNPAPTGSEQPIVCPQETLS